MSPPQHCEPVLALSNVRGRSHCMDALWNSLLSLHMVQALESVCLGGACCSRARQAECWQTCYFAPLLLTAPAACFLRSSRQNQAVSLDLQHSVLLLLLDTLYFVWGVACRCMHHLPCKARTSMQSFRLDHNLAHTHLM